MRITYPRSFLSLLLIGFIIVATPLLFALFSSALAFERLAGLAEQAVHSAVKVTQASRALLGATAALERSARQYALAGDATFLDAYRGNRASFLEITRQLDTMVLQAGQREEVAAIEAKEASVNDLINTLGPGAALSGRLPREFAALADQGQALVRRGDRVIDEGIEQLREQAVQSRNSVFWLMIALIPTAMLLIAWFTFLIARPITQVSDSIRGLGEGDFARQIRIDGPGDLVRLGDQLDWLRERLVTLEAQKTRFPAHSHDWTPLRASRRSDLLSSGWSATSTRSSARIAHPAGELDRAQETHRGPAQLRAVHARPSYLDARSCSCATWCAAW
jgi:two-component system sensor histidine kinase GlrK